MLVAVFGLSVKPLVDVFVLAEDKSSISDADSLEGSRNSLKLLVFGFSSAKPLVVACIVDFVVLRGVVGEATVVATVVAVAVAVVVAVVSILISDKFVGFTCANRTLLCL